MSIEQTAERRSVPVGNARLDLVVDAHLVEGGLSRQLVVVPKRWIASCGEIVLRGITNLQILKS